MIWSAADKFASQGGQFVIGVVLARLLMPEDFGLIGMLSIFIAISQSLIDSGMGSGLIQKKNRTDIDFSTVFVFNFIVSILIYGILFFSAPLIADFYNIPQLAFITRVLTINIVVNSLAIVQRSKLIINLDFKTIAKVNVVTVFLGGAIGLFFAYKGLGVWALVIQRISRSVISVIMFWILNKWSPSILFSKQSFSELFGFGSKLLISGLIGNIFNNTYNIAIGKAYSAAELGFYTSAKGFVELSAGTVTGILHQVTYPILATLQDDRKRMAHVFRRLIKMSTFFIFPSMTLLALLADPFIRLVLTEKWLPVVPLLQWMCFAKIFYPISAINMNILNAMGRSDLFLKIDLSKLPMALIALVITIPLGLKAMVIGHVVTSFLAFFINAYYPGKYFGYGALRQLNDILSIMIATLLMAASVFFIIYFVNILWLKLLVGIIVGGVLYYSFALVLKIEEIKEIKALINRIK